MHLQSYADSGGSLCTAENLCYNVLTDRIRKISPSLRLRYLRYLKLLFVHVYREMWSCFCRMYPPPRKKAWIHPCLQYLPFLSENVFVKQIGIPCIIRPEIWTFISFPSEICTHYLFSLGRLICNNLCVEKRDFARLSFDLVYRVIDGGWTLDRSNKNNRYPQSRNYNETFFLILQDYRAGNQSLNFEEYILKI